MVKNTNVFIKSLNILFFNSSGTLSPQKERFVSGNSSMDSYSGMKIKQEAEEDPVVRVD